jgi:hypothetical protein
MLSGSGLNGFYAIGCVEMEKYTGKFYPVLQIRIRDPVPFDPLDPGPRIPDPKPIFLRA